MAAKPLTAGCLSTHRCDKTSNLSQDSCAPWQVEWLTGEAWGCIKWQRRQKAAPHPHSWGDLGHLIEIPSPSHPPGKFC